MTSRQPVIRRSPLSRIVYTDEAMAKATNWTHLMEQYRGKWVALADDETTVLAAAATAKEAHQAALHRSKSPILYQVPETFDLFAGV